MRRDRNEIEQAAETTAERLREFGDDTADAAGTPPDLRSVERLLASLNRTEEDPFQLPKRKARQRSTADSHTPLNAWALQPLPTLPVNQERAGLLAWLFLAAGLMAFACGAVMLVWAIAASREDLWVLGIPLALGGQGAIIFGLLGVAEAAGQRHKQAAAALEEHRQRLMMLQNLALANGARSRQAA